jgi:hypothetical protein
VAICASQLRSCVAPPPLAAQPLTKEKVGAGEFGTKPSSAEPVDRLAIEAISSLALAQDGA